VVIGAITDSQRLRVLAEGELLADMPLRALIEECPLYELRPARPSEPLYARPVGSLPPEATPREALLALLASPNLASRRPLFEQYDAIVQSRTVRRPEQADAAVLAIGEDRIVSERDPPASGVLAPAAAATPESHRPPEAPAPGLAVSIDGNGRRVAADPYQGTVAAVLECASNLACVGAEPLGTTNNLNFGNPEKGHVAWQLSESVRGLGDACRALAAPIVGGNVSLYNEGRAGPIYPTPVIGMVGRLPDARRAGHLGFQTGGEQIALVGPFRPSLGASELAKLRGETLPDGLDAIDLEAVKAAQAAVRDAVRAGVLSSAHDIAEGGLAVALAECCLAGGVGAEVGLGEELWQLISPPAPRPAAGPPTAAQLTAGLFGEGSGAFVVSGERERVRELGGAVSVLEIGTVGGEELRISAGGEAAAPVLTLSLAELRRAHSALEQLLS
jgi:phosphoribosylformylglycinamidine synthase